jgi:hypothetical protein
MNLRIHGDNIVECERTLRLIKRAYNAEVQPVSACIYVPVFKLITEDKKHIKIELFAGHDRWGVSITGELSKHGAPLREAADAYVTAVSQDTETLLFAVEYCGALPAGNNAWQRNGRALTCAKAGVPYLYFAEIGGVELDADRRVKAPRFPNPIVPFSYLTASAALQVICMPVYQAHPAIDTVLWKTFSPAFGYEAGVALIKCLIEQPEQDSKTNEQSALEQKGLALVHLLSRERRSVDTFRDAEWDAFLQLKSGAAKTRWIKELPDAQRWTKKTSAKVRVTPTFNRLIAETNALRCFSIGAKDIPICLIMNGTLARFARILKSIYTSDAKIQAFADSLLTSDKPLLVVWITGFKPRGDDSRPDRGLVPLARMLFGNDIAILSVVYGPAKPSTWKSLREQPRQLAEENGLWQSILGLSDYVLADSATSSGTLFLNIARTEKLTRSKVMFPAARAAEAFGEHDVDTAVHAMFTNMIPVAGVTLFELMCNPPGGDWSGVSYFEKANAGLLTEYRWTSLPRVSAVQAKRPDHVIQISVKETLYFLVIESKLNAGDLEDFIGGRLADYLETLFKGSPTAAKTAADPWRLYGGERNPVPAHTILSGGAFRYKDSEDLAVIAIEKQLDVILAFAFRPYPEPSALHIYCTEKASFLINIFTVLSKKFGGNLEIHIC